MIDAESYKKLMDALQAVFDSLKGMEGDTSSSKDEPKPKGEALTVITVKKAKDERGFKIPKLKKEK